MKTWLEDNTLNKFKESSGTLTAAKINNLIRRYTDLEPEKTIRDPKSHKIVRTTGRYRVASPYKYSNRIHIYIRDTRFFDEDKMKIMKVLEDNGVSFDEGHLGSDVITAYLD